MTTLVRALLLSLALLFVPGVAQAATAPASAVTPFVPQPGDDPALVAAWQAWEKKEIDNYTTTVQLSCFCVESPVVSTVVRRDKVRAVYEARSRSSSSEGYSMDRLFTMIRDAQASADSVTVKYSARGIPKSIAIDPIKMAADEESFYSVRLWRR